MCVGRVLSNQRSYDSSHSSDFDLADEVSGLATRSAYQERFFPLRCDHQLHQPGFRRGRNHRQSCTRRTGVNILQQREDQTVRQIPGQFHVVSVGLFFAIFAGVTHFDFAGGSVDQCFALDS